MTHAPPEPCLGTVVLVIIWCNSRAVNARLSCCYACQEHLEEHACMSQILAGVGSRKSSHERTASNGRTAQCAEVPLMLGSTAQVRLRSAPEGRAPCAAPMCKACCALQLTATFSDASITIPCPLLLAARSTWQQSHRHPSGAAGLNGTPRRLRRPVHAAPSA